MDFVFSIKTIIKAALQSRIKNKEWNSIAAYKSDNPDK
jgi:hypothetical protein